MKKFFQNPYVKIASLIVISLILTGAFTLFGVTKALRIGLIFIVANSIIAFLIGKIMHQFKLKWYWLFLFPVIFAGLVLIVYADYNYFFAGVYLLISLIGYNANSIYK